MTLHASAVFLPHSSATYPPIRPPKMAPISEDAYERQQ